MEELSIQLLRLLQEKKTAKKSYVENVMQDYTQEQITAEKKNVDTAVVFDKKKK
jgi:hypothetical protein